MTSAFRALTPAGLECGLQSVLRLCRHCRFSNTTLWPRYIPPRTFFCRCLQFLDAFSGRRGERGFSGTYPEAPTPRKNQISGRNPQSTALQLRGMLLNSKCAQGCRPLWASAPCSSCTTRPRKPISHHVNLIEYIRGGSKTDGKMIMRWLLGLMLPKRWSAEAAALNPIEQHAPPKPRLSYNP